MTYQELVAEVQACASSMDAKAITDHLAVQFNVEGEGEGAFYLEISSGHISVEPYDYVDNDMVVIATAKQILDIFKGKLDPSKALEQGKIKAEGNVGRIGLLNEIIKKTPAKKTTAAKKPAAKKETATAKKATAKPAEKKETVKAATAKKEAEAKPAEKKETAAAKKAEEAKPAEKKETAKVTAAAKKETTKADPKKKAKK